LFIVRASILMLAAIEFNYKSSFNTGEVGNVGSNWMLAPEPACIQR